MTISVSVRAVGGHLGNMLIRPPWDKFFNVNSKIIQVDIPLVLKVILEFSSPGVHWILFLLPN